DALVIAVHAGENLGDVNRPIGGKRGGHVGFYQGKLVTRVGRGAEDLNEAGGAEALDIAYGGERDEIDESVAVEGVYEARGKAFGGGAAADVGEAEGGSQSEREDGKDQRGAPGVSRHGYLIS